MDASIKKEPKKYPSKPPNTEKIVAIKKTRIFIKTIKFKNLFLYNFSGVCVIEFLLKPIDK